MNKKSILIIVLILAVIIAVAALSFGKDGGQTPAEKTEATTVNVTEPNVEDPTIATEDTLPEGWVEDGDDETLPPVETVTPTETTSATEATNPEEIVLEEDDPDEVVLEEDTPKEETVPPTTQGGATEVSGMTYAQYMAMSAAEQRAYMESFPTVDDFFAWFNAAKEAHESGSSIIIDGSNSIDMGEIAGKK